MPGNHVHFMGPSTRPSLRYSAREAKGHLAARTWGPTAAKGGRAWEAHRAQQRQHTHPDKPTSWGGKKSEVINPAAHQLAGKRRQKSMGMPWYGCCMGAGTLLALAKRRSSASSFGVPPTRNWQGGEIETVGCGRVAFSPHFPRILVPRHLPRQPLPWREPSAEAPAPAPGTWGGETSWRDVIFSKRTKHRRGVGWACG